MVKSQFSYCSLVQMFRSRNANNLIDKILERFLTLITNDKTSTFEHLLKANNEITIHQINLLVLTVEVFKIIDGFASAIMQDLLLFREYTHNIRNFQIIPDETTVKCRTLGKLLWANLPEKYKSATSLHSFKRKIKTWKCETSVCRLCQTMAY